ncbi:MAG: HupE/UreJ family protein, partial [Granulosicoccus sp.]
SQEHLIVVLSDKSNTRVLHWLASLVLLVVMHAVLSPSAHAHAPRENYVWVNIESDHVSGRFEINKGDIEKKLGIELPGEGDELLSAVNDSAAQVQQYLLENFALSYNGEQQDIQFLDNSLFNDTSAFVQYHFRVEGVPEDDQVSIRNTVFLTENFMKDDRLHRSLIVLEYNKYRGLDFGHESTALVFGPDTLEKTLDVADPPQILVWKDFFYQGLLHIWLGLDHMLFLLTLLLTVVLIRPAGRWEPAPGWRKVFLNTLTIVTVFTLSHSITLALAALGYINLPSGPIEAIIALSIIVVALNNIFPVFAAHTWLLILSFGLIHGVGFASALGDLQFRNVSIEKILLMFNIGVEVGQVVVVLLVLPLLFFIRNKLAYSRVIMPCLSAFSVVVATVWLGSRVGWWA